MADTDVWTEETTQQYCERWCKNDREAVLYLRRFMNLAHLADDFIDEEIKGGLTERSRAMTELLSICLVEIPANPFYLKHELVFRPIIANILLQYHAANTWQNRESEWCLWSYIWRCGIEQMVGMVAMVCGGRAHAHQALEEYRTLWFSEGETFQTWREEHVRRR